MSQRKIKWKRVIPSQEKKDEIEKAVITILNCIELNNMSNEVVLFAIGSLLSNIIRNASFTEYEVTCLFNELKKSSLRIVKEHNNE